jgi:hypothetical protein
MEKSGNEPPAAPLSRRELLKSALQLGAVGVGGMALQGKAQC